MKVSRRISAVPESRFLCAPLPLCQLPETKGRIGLDVPRPSRIEAVHGQREVGDAGESRDFSGIKPAARHERAANGAPAWLSIMGCESISTALEVSSAIPSTLLPRTLRVRRTEQPIANG
jgi:hypothetical protein